MEGLGMKKVGIFYGHLEYITAILYILLPFGNLVAVWYIFPHFGILNKEKSGNPAFYALSGVQVCQTEYFHTKNSQFLFWKALA
jgi:hypothetical protein